MKNQIPKKYFISFLCLLFLNNTKVIAQKISNKPLLPISQLPFSFRNQLKTVNKEMVTAYWYRPDSVIREIRNYPLSQIINFIDKEKDYELIFRASFWLALDSANYTIMIPELINRLTNNTEIGLSNCSDINISDRIRTKQLKYNNTNYQVDDDLFQVAGRANWLLKRIAKNEFGIVKIKSTPEELKAIQTKWIKWFNALKVK